MPIEYVQTLIVGGGQAGVAMSEHLSRRGVPHLVVERHRIAERWRTELIQDDEALTRWMQLHPDTDSQRLRSLVRAARRDAAGLAPEARQPRSQRELFQFIRPQLLSPTESANNDERTPG